MTSCVITSILPEILSFLKQLVCIGGPTASGKTALAIALAQIFNTEIVSFDSRQIYKELNIGVARPQLKQLQSVKHHFIAELSVTEHYSVGDYVRQALERVNSLFLAHDTVIAVGGTGFYLDSLVHPLDEMPAIDDTMRQQAANFIASHSLDEVKQKVNEIDPIQFERMDTNNLLRMQRVLEIYFQTGLPMSSFFANKTKCNFPDIKIHRFALLPERKSLYQKIDLRVLEMIDAGLVSEVNSLKEFRYLKALNTVGYKEFVHYFDGIQNLETTIKEIQQHSRNYAKRQYTWFRNQSDWTAIASENLQDQLAEISFLLDLGIQQSEDDK